MSLSDIDSYFDLINAEIARIPRDAALAMAEEVFQAVVHTTRIDSGQAALNWRLEPYENAPAILPQEMLWGYGNISPVTPAGYKWSKSDNSEGVFIFQFEYMMNQIALAPDDIAGVAIYNPITPGFPEFAPGSDEFYEQIAFERIDIATIVSNAVASVEARYKL